MLRAADNPPVLAPWAESIADLDGRWWVAHAKPRNEKAFAWDLHRRGIGYFLPLYEKVTISSGKRRTSLKPVFPSYVFFCGSDEDRRAALTTNRVAHTLPVADQAQLVRELSYLERAIVEQAPIGPSAAITDGRTCRVVSGPLRGVEGVAVTRGNVSTIFLKVSVLAGGALLEIDADLLEPID